MQVYQGVAITDGVNRKNQILPLETLINAYRDAGSTVIPVIWGMTEQNRLDIQK